jgi:hypothetical protein
MVLVFVADKAAGNIGKIKIYAPAQLIESDARLEKN